MSSKIKKALKFDVKTMTSMAVLIAIQIIFSRFLSIQAWNFRIGFGFVPIVIAGIMFGAVRAGIVAGISDILGALLFGYGFTPLITIPAILTGIVFGLFLHKKPTTARIILSVLVVQIFCSLLLNSFFLYIMYFSESGTTLFAFIMTRVAQTAAMIAVEVAITLALGKVFLPKLKLITSDN